MNVQRRRRRARQVQAVWICLAACLGIVLVMVVFLVSGELATNLANLQVSHTALDTREDESGQAAGPLAAPYLQGMLHLETEPEQAIAYFDQALAQPRRTLAREMQLEGLARLGAWGQVQEILLSTVSVDDAYLVLLVGRGITAASAEEMPRWLEIVQRRQPRTLLGHARDLLAEQRFVDAEQWARAVLFPDQRGEARLIVGRSLFYQQKFEAAVAALRPLYDGEPAAVQAAFWYGRALLYAGQPASAIPVLAAAAQRDLSPTSTWYLADLAAAHLALGECRPAAATVDEAYARHAYGEVAGRLDALRAAIDAQCPGSAAGAE